MATTGITNGTLIKIQIDGVTVSHLTTNGISKSHAPRGATTKDSAGWEESLEGLLSWTASGEGMVAEDATNGYNEMQAAMDLRAKVVVKMTSLVAGDTEQTGDAFIETLDLTAPLEESTTFSISLKGTGPLVASTIV